LCFFFAIGLSKKLKKNGIILGFIFNILGLFLIVLSWNFPYLRNAYFLLVFGKVFNGLGVILIKVPIYSMVLVVF
jgi:hypothetical protein